MSKIALHELGHTFGLDHHSYEEDEDCLMVGDETLDCTGEVDSGNLEAFLEKLRPMLLIHGGVCLVSDAEWLLH